MRHDVKRWCLMMDFCKKQKLPPAQKWAWDMAEKAYSFHQRHITPEFTCKCSAAKRCTAE